MNSPTTWDVRLPAGRLKGRTFILGNKRAFSLSLPAATGTSAATSHPHKWFGAYVYGRKFLQGQLARLPDRENVLLNSRRQTELTMGLTSACRRYEVGGRPIEETFFVPDGVQAFACVYSGDEHLAVEPEFDMRFYRALNRSTRGYSVEAIQDGIIVSHPLPSGTFDDSTETFLANEAGGDAGWLYAAVQVIGCHAAVDLVPERLRAHRKVYRKDAQRHRFLASSGTEEASDHAPLWHESRTQVFAPVRLHIAGEGAVVYGFGGSREEALDQLGALRDNLDAFRVRKSDAATEIVNHARLETGAPVVDKSYVQVLTRLMDALVARHAVAEDTVLARPATTILAGNQYFHDSWKRDENIALGFLLSLGFYDLARDVIADTWQLQDEATGRLPQRIRAGENPPYHSSDGTLWALWRLHQYRRCTGDESLLHEKLPMVKRFFRRSIDRSVNGMLPSGRTQAADYLWETWMDTPHTPRDGFPVEIQMLWIACLRVFRPILRDPDPELEAAMERAESAAWLALQRFYCRGIPADSLDERGDVRDLITPNPYFCFGLGLDLGAEVEQLMRRTGRQQLAGKQGIITLSPDDWARVFPAEFVGDRRHVRGRRMRSIGKFNYHRGVEWNWLAQFFVRAELKYGDPDVAFRTYLRGQVSAALSQAGIGGISELFDLSGTRGPEFQAWSMSGFLEGIQAFAGVEIDVPRKRISIEPQIPGEWPGLSARKWYGSIPFDVRYRASGESISLQVDFPHELPRDVDLELVLTLPARHIAKFLDARLDGYPQSPGWCSEPLPGTDRVRVRCFLPAARSLDVRLGLHKSGRVPVTRSA